MSASGSRGPASGRGLLLTAALLSAACLGVPPPPAGLEELVVLPDSLPRGPAAAGKFLQQGDAAWDRRDDPGMPDAARQAYWRAIAADPQQPDGYWKAARASVLVGRLLEGKEARGDAFLRGLRTTQLLLATNDQVAEAHYYYALNLGLLAKERPSRGHEAVKEMLPHLEKTIELAPQLDEAGGYRTLALVYLRAPGWPASVGDDEAGLEYAGLAVEKAPDHPGNHLALAEALLAMGDEPEAHAEVERARELAALPRWTQRERNDFLEQATSLAPAVTDNPGPSAAGAGGPDTTIADLSWISGSWQMVDSDGRYEEHWTPAAENALLGMARNLSDGRMVFFEYLRIEAREDGIYYVAQPKGRPGIDFKLTGFDGTSASFENPQHDFPRRITYHWGNGDSMTARIDGGPGSDKPATTFEFERMVPGP